MNERFLFFPSVGFTLAAGYGLVLAFNSKKNEERFPSFQFLFLLVLILFLLKTLDRNKAWANNKTLFLTDVKTSAGSAKGNCMAGGALYEAAVLMPDGESKHQSLNQSIQYLERALEIYPNYVDALLLIGNAVHLRDSDCEKSLEYYSKLFKLSPNHKVAFSNLNSILNKCKGTKVKLVGYQTILQYQPQNFDANYKLGLTYGKAMGDLVNAAKYLENAVKIRPENKTVIRDLGVVYAMQQKYEKSIQYFEKVIELEPKDPENYINLGVSFQNMGRFDEAASMFAKADSLKAK